MKDRERDHREEMKTADLASTPARSTEELAEAANRESRAMKGDGEDALLPPRELNDLKSQWTEIQSKFVDEPRRSVEEADGLVADTIKRLAESFAEARSTLENQWARGNDVSTEDLRVALRRYHSFFERLLTV